MQQPVAQEAPYFDFEDIPQIDEEQRNEQVLDIIGENSRKAGKNERMTWNALYSLKRQEMEMNSRMNAEIDRVKDTYQKKKEDLQREVVGAVMGRAQSGEGKPKELPNFWRGVFEATGMLNQEEDADCMDLLSEFTCESSHDEEESWTRIRFVFRDQTPLFTNRELQMEVRGVGGQQKVTIRQPLRLKEKVGGSNSIFSELFGANGESEEVVRMVRQIYQNYMNCIYFYLQSCKVDITTSQQRSLSSSPRKKVKV